MENLYLEQKIILSISKSLLDYHETSIWHIDEDIINSLLFELSLPGTIASEDINKPYLLKMLLDRLLLDPKNRNETINQIYIENCNKLYETDKDQEFIRFRFFLPSDAIYYGNEIVTADAAYCISNEIPFIAVKSKWKWICDENLYNEIGWITRSEVRLLSALCFGTHYGYRVFQLGRTIDVDSSLFPQNLFSENGIDELRKSLIIIKKFYSDLDDYPPSFTNEFKFAQEKNNIVMDLYNRFDINNRLLLRTALHFLKAGMLYYQGNKYAEEGFANMYFGLEGILRLIFYKHFPNSRFEIQKTKDILDATFPDQYFSDALADFYNNRIRIVHPEPDFENEDWFFSASADDFLDNYGWIKILLIYVITDKIEPTDMEKIFS